MLTLPFPNIDRVAFSIGPLQIQWYSRSYTAGLIRGWLYIRNLVLQQRLWPHGVQPFSAAKADDLLIYIAVGAVAGGRLGFVLFYEPGYYLDRPLEILYAWQGGMAFHGALLGCGLAIWLFSARNRTNPLSAMDVCAAAVPIGLFFGRLANFIDGELWARPTPPPWGIVFPAAQKFHRDSLPVPRHLSQFYKAALAGLALFLLLHLLFLHLLLLHLLTHRHGALQSPGLATGMFLLDYGIARSFCELFRQFDPGHVFSNHGFTPGVVYSIPTILLSWWFIRSAQTRPVV